MRSTGSRYLSHQSAEQRRHCAASARERRPAARCARQTTLARPQRGCAERSRDSHLRPRSNRHSSHQSWRRASRRGPSSSPWRAVQGGQRPHIQSCSSHSAVRCPGRSCPGGDRGHRSLSRRARTCHIGIDSSAGAGTTTLGVMTVQIIQQWPHKCIERVQHKSSSSGHTSE